MANVEVPSGVGWTALLTAYSRAQETENENALFDDPLARVFIESASRHSTGAERLPRLGPAIEDDSSALWDRFKFHFSQRTPFFDHQVLRAVESGCTQLVVMGAGLDSRAFRLGLPRHIRVFELDDASVLDFKRDVLNSRGIRSDCMRTPLAVDLAADWRAALTSAGFDRRPRAAGWPASTSAVASLIQTSPTTRWTSRTGRPGNWRTARSATARSTRGITVNCVAPGRISTPRVQQIYPHGLPAQAVGEIPAGRFGTPEEFAAVACFLASTRASYVTGTTVTVDGGLSRALA